MEKIDNSMELQSREMEKIDNSMELQSRDYVAVEISPVYESVVSSIIEKMENVSSSTCIFRIPEELARNNEKVFVPVKLSIGPFHHGKPDLKSMEDHKWQYLYSLLSRKPNLEANLNVCVKALKDLENRARKCYAETIDLSSDVFIQIMLVDGCFLIELFLLYAIKTLRQRNDPIFKTPGMLYELRCDLVLLEIQIPIFVLQILFQILPIPKQCTHAFYELAFSFFRNMIPGDPLLVHSKFSQESCHLLDIIHHCFLPTSKKLEAKDDTTKKSFKECGNKLLKSGIRFKKSKSKSLLDVKFDNGVLEIPHLKIHQCTEVLFRNLIAFEHCQIDRSEEVKSYILLVGSLVSSAEDVKLLERNRILGFEEDTEKEVAQLFERMCSGVNVKESHYAGLYEQVEKYVRRKSRLKWKEIKRNHLQTPFSPTVVALVLVLTFVAALFSVLSFSFHF